MQWLHSLRMHDFSSTANRLLQPAAVKAGQERVESVTTQPPAVKAGQEQVESVTTQPPAVKAGQERVESVTTQPPAVKAGQEQVESVTTQPPAVKAGQEQVESVTTQPPVVKAGQEQAESVTTQPPAVKAGHEQAEPLKSTDQSVEPKENNSSALIASSTDNSMVTDVPLSWNKQCFQFCMTCCQHRYIFMTLVCIIILIVPLFSQPTTQRLHVCMSFKINEI